MIFISVGFDAHWNDPITSLGLSSTGYWKLARKAIALAEEFCHGKIVFVLEGGYDPDNVANGTRGVFDALQGTALSSDVNDPSPHREPDCASRIEEVRRWHMF